MQSAEATLRRFIPFARITKVGGTVMTDEKVKDPDGRVYRLRYLSTADGKRANAYCTANPWGAKNGGADYFKAHVDEDGFLCLGHGSTRQMNRSPFKLDFVIRRARYWCAAFSYFKENGTFVDPDEERSSAASSAGGRGTVATQAPAGNGRPRTTGDGAAASLDMLRRHMRERISRGTRTLPRRQVAARATQASMKPPRSVSPTGQKARFPSPAWIRRRP